MFFNYLSSIQADYINPGSMRNLILGYFENVKDVEGYKPSNFTYNDNLNLTVDNEGKPAILKASLATQTSTKTYDEASDSDHDYRSLAFHTSTITLVDSESSDSDNDIRNSMWLATQTLTRSQEVQDADR